MCLLCLRRTLSVASSVAGMLYGSGSEAGFTFIHMSEWKISYIFLWRVRLVRKLHTRRGVTRTGGTERSGWWHGRCELILIIGRSARMYIVYYGHTPRG